MNAPIRAMARGAVVVALLAVVAGGALAATPVVSTAHNARLHATVLVNRSDHTLYQLSVERKGHFICTNSACLSVWKPLIVPKGTKPVGRVPLGVVRRPDGRSQVTYKGGPLYSFAQDTRPGDARGQGFRDVGVWRAATVGAAAQTTTTPTGYGYGR